MKLELTIDQLVLDGLPALSRAEAEALRVAVETELGRLFAERGFSAPVFRDATVTDALRTAPISIAVGARPSALGVQIARAVHGGMTR
jgi:hypothetical protein